MSEPGSTHDREAAWDSIQERLRARGLRWTAQRRTLVAVLSEVRGHLTGAELIDRCRARDPATTPSTVYRTLDVLEELGLVQHGHGADGREEYHVLPDAEHGHLHCSTCAGTWEISADEGAAIVASFAAGRGFAVDLSHVTVVGRCAACRGSQAGRGANPGGARPAGARAEGQRAAGRAVGSRAEGQH